MAKAQDILACKGPDVITVSPEETVLAAASKMNQHRIGAVVVVEPLALGVVGIFTERDILRRVVAEGRDPATTQVSEVMTARLTTCRPDTPLEECRGIMTSKRCRHLPIMEDGRLAGMISIGDIMAREVAMQQTTIDYLHEYLHGRI